MTDSLEVKLLKQTSYELVTKFVDGCSSELDLVIISQEKSGSFDCPVLGREVKLSETGFCTETRTSCKEHY